MAELPAGGPYAMGKMTSTSTSQTAPHKIPGRCSWLFAPSVAATYRGFTLIELMVVIAVIALLLSILLPGLAAARAQAKSAVCRSNVRQIVIVNGYYAEDNKGHYCPGAAGYLRNLDRWHGRRDRPSQPFDGTRGPLVPYLGPDEAIRQCPSFPAEDVRAGGTGFERSNGGYGYNNAYVGVCAERDARTGGLVVEDHFGTLADRIRRPGATIMFTDSAFAATTLIEYSFCEPRFHPRFPTTRADPSIHFRHRGKSSVAWCDGHVDGQPRSYSWSSGLYLGDPARLGVGWFGHADDNSLFDLE